MAEEETKLAEVIAHANRINKESWLEYLNLRYSKTTIKLYGWAFDCYGSKLYNQSQVNKFLQVKVYQSSNNPFYSGFLKAFIDCFSLPYVVIKSKRRKIKTIKEYKFLELDTILYMIDKLPPYYSLMVSLYFETGLRLRELILRSREDIDLEACSIKGIGKNAKPFKVKFSKDTALRLKKYLEVAPNKENPFMKQKVKDSAKSFYYGLNKECLKIGLEKITPHRLRHALGRFLRVNKGLDLMQIKAKLRHSNVATTEIYTISTQEEVDNRLEKEGFYNG
jgi:integrase